MNMHDFENLIADAKRMNPTFSIDVDDSGDDWLITASYDDATSPFSMSVLCTQERAYNAVHKIMLMALRELSKGEERRRL